MVFAIFLVGLPVMVVGTFLLSSFLEQRRGKKRKFIYSIFVDYLPLLSDYNGKLLPYEQCQIVIAQIMGKSYKYPREWHLDLRERLRR